ncbi:hypothetical protein PG996_013821 [Apiospora saccharicola]|uniref:Uncharacterized protein n=1 Tax=Apiospora saccharicola TaxID=335842 RepID=A0ABR1TH80_9PEZI
MKVRSRPPGSAAVGLLVRQLFGAAHGDLVNGLPVVPGDAGQERDEALEEAVHGVGGVEAGVGLEYELEAALSV